MDLEGTPPSTSLVRCCDCGCSCSSLVDRSLTGTWIRTVKRKFDEFEEGGYRLVIPGLNSPNIARVAIDNECVALREMVSSQQKTIQELSNELEKERNASSTAANEAMSMILRLQREKAESQMESRQFKGYVEEKMAHDQRELLALEDLLYKRELAIQSLTCEVLAYKHRMMSYGLTEFEAEGNDGAEVGMSLDNSSSLEILEDRQSEFSAQDYLYPPLKCNNSNENRFCKEPDNEAVAVEKYAFGESPWSRDHLKDLEYRINQLEKSPATHGQPEPDIFGTNNVLEKVIVGQSPSWPRDFTSFSTDFATDSPKLGGAAKNMESLQTEDSNLRKVDSASDMSDRIYTVDSVHNKIYTGDSVGTSEDYGNSTPEESLCKGYVGDPEIKNLYKRLQALEADRESMRKVIVSMRTDKAQMVLLKEIAQKLCKEMSPARRMPVKKPSLIGSFSIVSSVFKSIVSFVFWRKKGRRSKYMFGISANTPGLPTLLDNGPHVGQWRCLLSTQV
ncbi:hypothetical protein LguiB_009470 [Lonicera macranthoides]